MKRSYEMNGLGRLSGRGAFSGAAILFAAILATGPADGQGNVTVRTDSHGNLVVEGDASGNGISIQAFAVGEGEVVGLGTTLVNGADRAPFSAVTGDFRIRMGGGHDRVELDGGDGSEVPVDLELDTGSGNDVVLVRRWIVHDDLEIRTGPGDDVITLAQTAGGFPQFVNDKTDIRTSSGNDQVLLEIGDLPDTYLAFGDEFHVSTGAGRDFVSIRGAVFHDEVQVNLGDGDDRGSSGGPRGGLCVCNSIFLDEDVLDHVRFSGGDGSDGGVMESVCGLAPPGVVDDFLRFEFEPDDCSFLGGSACSGSCDGAGTEEPGEDEPEDSPGRLALLEDVSAAILPLQGTLHFVVLDAQLSTDPEDVLLLVNGTPVPSASLLLSPTEISWDYLLSDGRNDLFLLARDGAGLALTTEVVLWGGSHVLPVTVLEAGGAPAAGAGVSVTLVDALGVVVQATTGANGQTSFLVPARTLLVRASRGANEHATAGTLGSQGPIVLRFLSLESPSPVDNNDFSQGTAGWNVGTAPVSIVPHQEDAARVFADDLDLVLDTQGEGEQSISRTFELEPDTKNVTVRYRFITSEVPGGYFGTQYNDYYSVTIRSQQEGTLASDANSMNGLGLGAFTPGGATAWKETSLTVGDMGDVVQVDVAVANVADGFLDSQVIVDLVEESKLSITELSLFDIDNSSLQYLSSDSHTYFGGNTRIHGTITVEGAEDDELSALRLEVLQGGGVVAVASLAASAQADLLQAFGTDEKVEIISSRLLFELPSSQAALVNGTQNGTLRLRVVAEASSGEKAEKEFDSAVEILVQFKGGNRYGGRDEGRGGDDWVKPGVRTVANHYGSITVGDISNMNGGSFAPDHASHQAGVDVDGWFSGYNARDAATAATMIGLLNDTTYGSRIQLVYVTFQKLATDPFWTAIQNVTLADGRAAKNVIQPLGGHTTHFHWRIQP